MHSAIAAEVESKGVKVILPDQVREHIAQNGTGKTDFDGFDGGVDKEDLNHWPIPQPFPDGLRSVPTLPDSLIPASLRPWLADIAERLQVPLEFPAVAAIVCVASVIGNQVCIRPKRRDPWLVVPNLWGAIVGRPGVMKTPAINEPMKALYRLVKEAEAEYAEARKTWLFDKQAIEIKQVAVKEKMKKAAKGGSNLDEFRGQLEGEEIVEPTERRYVVNDTTVEKYGELLNQNPRGLLIFRDELTGWLRALDDDRRVNDRAFFLEAWNGDQSYVYDRIARGTLKISNTTTSILGGIQPSKLQSYLRGALDYGDDDDGLMQRLQLIVYPDISKDWKNVDRWPETEAKNRAFKVYKDLSDIGLDGINAERDGDGMPFLRFSDDAQELFNEWFISLNQALRGGSFEHPAIESHFSKYRSLMPSLALIFHLVDVASGASVSNVSLEATEKAAAWCEFLMAHAHRIYGLAIGAAAIHARTLAQHLQKGDLKDGFTAREVWVKGWSGLSRASEVTEPLDLLQSLGWLKSHDIRNPAGGRPTVQYFISPKIMEVRL